MATSGIHTTTMTVRDLITMAAELTDLVSEGIPTLPAYQAQLAMRHLNWLLKSMQVVGMDLYREEQIEIVWPADSDTRTMDEPYFDIPEIRVRNTSDIDRSLTRYDTRAYALIPNKFQAGDPVAFSFSKTATEAAISLWPVPTAETDLWMTGVRVVQDVTTLDQNIDIPQEWSETIAYKLADRLNTVFKLSGTPRGADVKARAEILYTIMRDADRPESHFFQPVL